jgi:tetratricopeptide (TPR) repeat protein
MVYKKQFSNTKRIAANKVIGLVTAGKISGAKAIIRKEFKPKTELYYFFNGWLKQLEGDHISAIKLFEKALIQNPLNQETLLGLSGSYLELGDYERAEECASHAVTIDNTSPKNLLTLATVISKSARHNKAAQLEAVSLFERAFNITSANVTDIKILVDIMSGWGASLLNLNEIFQAKKILEAAAKYDTFNTIVHKNLISVYANTNEISNAIKSAKIAQMSDNTELVIDSAYQEGMLELLRGNYAKGWRLHEVRTQSPKYKYKDLLSRGTKHFEGISKKDRILLFQEQGIGDLLQFAHCIPDIYNKCENIDLLVLPNTFLPMINDKPQSPKEFMQFNFGTYLKNIYVLGVDDIPYEYDFITSVMSLGYWLKISNTNKPKITKFTTNSEFTKYNNSVGLFWKGSVHYANDSLRSIPTSLINNLISNHKDINFVSLQIDRDEELIDADNLVKPKYSMQGLLNTLAVINSCDIIITVDSMIAHLAAGANKPVWIMQPYSPDWRWELEREDCLWYSTIKNFRQTEILNWDTVVGRIDKELTLLKKQVD